MPVRRFPLVTKEIYHIFNRGIDRRTTFIDSKAYQRALLTMEYYQVKSPPLKLSRFLTLPTEESKLQREKINMEEENLAAIIAFCFMPNHFHFLLKQLVEGGISRFMSNFQNSFTRYFNTRQERVGPIFLGQFKAIRIESEEQLLHVSRYIHLNPYSSSLVKSAKALEDYPWSSLGEYLRPSEGGACEKEVVLSSFKDEGEYRKFVFDQADYQRNLDGIKHLLFEL